MDVKTAIANFDVWCQDNRSLNTRLLYRSRLRGLESFTLEDGCAVAAIELDALTRENVEAWLAAARKGKAPDTERANAIAFKAFQAWAVDYGHLKAAVVAKIKKPMGRQRDRIPEDDETAALLADAPRAFVIMYTALRHSGARPNELCRATIADYDAKRSVIVLEQHKTAEKTGKPRKIGVGQVMRELLAESIGNRTEGPLFLSTAREGLDGRLAERSISQAAERGRPAPRFGALPGQARARDEDLRQARHLRRGRGPRPQEHQNDLPLRAPLRQTAARPIRTRFAKRSALRGEVPSVPDKQGNLFKTVRIECRRLSWEKGAAPPAREPFDAPQEVRVCHRLYCPHLGFLFLLCGVSDETQKCFLRGRVQFLGCLRWQPKVRRHRALLLPRELTNCRKNQPDVAKSTKKIRKNGGVGRFLPDPDVGQTACQPRIFFGEIRGPFFSGPAAIRALFSPGPPIRCRAIRR